MMFNRVSPETLEPRLDADFYKKEFIENQLKLKASGAVRLSSLIDVGKSCYGVLPKSAEYVESGVPLIRGGDLSFGQVNPPEVHAPKSYAGSKGTAKEGDVLILIKGACIDGPDGVARVSEKEQGYIFNGSCYRLAFKKRELDGYFFIAYSQTRQFLMQKKRQVANTGISYNDEDSILSYLLPNLSDRTKQYIGDKVRQAEQLRAWAKELRAEVDTILNELNLPTAKAPAMINRVSVELLDTRLDPRPYRTHYIGLVDQIKMIKNSMIADISELASGCPLSSDDFVETGEVPLIRIRNIGFDEFIDIATGVDKSVYAEEAKYQAKEDMIVLGMDGIFRAQFFLAGELPMLVNQRVAMLSTTDIRAELLTHWINRAEGQMQLNQWAVKTTVEHTSLSDIGRVRIPRLERDVEDQLADKLLNARLAYRYSRLLSTAAKILVEALIEGQLDENQLIEAQDQLQTGNDNLDRSILNRLKTDGVDGKGQPLFSDLDQLYSLLEQAENP